jgi:hypothetical protein
VSKLGKEQVMAACGGDPAPEANAASRSTALHASPCVSAGADSARVAAAAIAAANLDSGDSTGFKQLDVTRYERMSGGVLVTLFPQRVMTGGGARVWVPAEGCAVVRETME